MPTRNYTKTTGLFRRTVIGSLFLVLFYIGCTNKKELWKFLHGHPGEGDQTGVAMLLTWNDAATQAVARVGTGPDGPMPPMPESRIYAMVNVAMYDALNSIFPVNSPYALLNMSDRDASPDAALAKAAHDVIVALLPPEAGYADSIYRVSIAAIADGTARTKGIKLGAAAAAAMLAKRTSDGAAEAQTAYTPGTLPGNYRATPPFDGPPFNGFVAVPGWGKITPFGVASASQFRPVAPYSVNSAAYTSDYNDIKQLGGATGSTRSAGQTEIGLFWLENCPLGWNRIARGLIRERSLDAWAAARLLGLLHIALADANISCLEAKYYYNFWRPITAVRLGETDGNPDTKGDPSWDVLAPPTPPVPDYPSNHATNGGAAAAILKDFFGNDRISFTATSSSLPGVSRNYSSFSQASRDNALSRIYVGYHFRNAVMKGESMGEKIGDYVFGHVLKPR
jgi:hypothetical protein